MEPLTWLTLLILTFIHVGILCKSQKKSKSNKIQLIFIIFPFKGSREGPSSAWLSNQYKLTWFITASEIGSIFDTPDSDITYDGAASLADSSDLPYNLWGPFPMPLERDKWRVSIGCYGSFNFSDFCENLLKWLKERIRRVNWVSVSTHSYLKIESGPWKTNLLLTQILNSSLLCSWQGPSFYQTSGPFFKPHRAHNYK